MSGPNGINFFKKLTPEQLKQMQSKAGTGSTAKTDGNKKADGMDMNSSIMVNSKNSTAKTSSTTSNNGTTGTQGNNYDLDLNNIFKQGVKNAAATTASR